jgi:hypothetical protein
MGPAVPQGQRFNPGLFHVKRLRKVALKENLSSTNRQPTTTICSSVSAPVLCNSPDNAAHYHARSSC